MTPKILVTLPLTAENRRHLDGKGAGASIRYGDAASVGDEDLAWAEIVLGNLKPPERLLERSNIRWLHSPNVGLDAYRAVSEARPELKVTNTKGIADDVVSEHALALLLGLSRRVPAMVRAQDVRRYDRDAFQEDRCITLAGKSVHVLGFGSIAQCLVRKLHGLSMDVTVYRRRAEGRNASVNRFAALSELPNLAGKADVLINLLPDLPATRELVNGAIFGAMKPDALFVNVGRGATVDEDALVEALRGGRLRGAALDVFAVEPLPENSPLWKLPNVLLSPHVAGRFDREMEIQIDNFFEKLEATANDE